jgi:transposase
VAALNGCTHVAMEATGIYWKPVWHILDDGEFELVLASAAHVKNVPGRKTDVNDAMRLAELFRPHREDSRPGGASSNSGLEKRRPQTPLQR